MSHDIRVLAEEVRLDRCAALQSPFPPDHLAVTSPQPSGNQPPDDAGSDGSTGPDRWFTRGVAGVGAASLCSDTGHEMVTSLLPSFVSSVLHAGPAALGAIEGVSDALIGLSKLAGGPLSNDPRRRARLAASGYLGTGLATAAIGLTTAVWQVALLRAAAWISRGLRSPARDSLLTSLVPSSAYGRAFGVERAGDNAGAILGPLLAALLVTMTGVRTVILLAIVPGLLAAVAITTAASETRRLVGQPRGRQQLRLNLRRLHRLGLTRVLTPVLLFEFGNLANTLLILRASEVLASSADGEEHGRATTVAILLYAAHNVAATGTALVSGRIADRGRPQRIFAAGAAVYVLAYLLFAWPHDEWWLLAGAFVLAGIGIGIAETVESTMVARQLPDALRGSGFGVLGLAQSLGDLGATLVAGLLWAVASPTVAFSYTAIWMVAALIASLSKLAGSPRLPKQM